MGEGSVFATIIGPNLVPGAAIAFVAFYIIKGLREQSTSRVTSAIEVTPEILEGVREDLRHATEEMRLARVESATSRARAEEAEAARDAEREMRRHIEDQFYSYRVDARAWTALLISQIVARGDVPAKSPEGFNI